MPKTERKILSIINDVQNYDLHGDIKDFFIDGYCYDFAYMLWRSTYGTEIIYLKDIHHYVLSYKNDYYDVTGKLSGINTDISNIEYDTLAKYPKDRKLLIMEKKS